METNGKFEIDERDVEYQNLAGKPWLARVYQPKGSGPFPTIVDVHGGAWHNGDRIANAGIDRALAANGILVAALDFRQPPEAGYPASICDINLAVRWLKLHAAEFNGTTAVGAFGNSSGGHQVVLSALRPRHPSYSALPLPQHPEINASLSYVIAGWPVIDPLYRFRYAKEINNQEHIKAHIEYWRTEETMAEGSPQTIVERQRARRTAADTYVAEGERQKPSAGNAGALHRVLSETRRNDRGADVRWPARAPNGPVAGPAGHDACHRHHHGLHSAPNWLKAIRAVRHDNLGNLFLNGKQLKPYLRMPLF